MIDLLWKLFNKTGNIKYYNLLVKLRDEVNEKQHNKNTINYSDSNNNSYNNDKL